MHHVGGPGATIKMALEKALEDSSRRFLELASDQTSPSQKVAKGELLHRLAEGMEALPEDQRTAIELRQLAGYTVNEVAEAMGRSPASVAGLLRRGLKALRHHFSAPTSDG